MSQSKSNTTTNDSNAAPDGGARVLARRSFLPLLVFAVGGMGLPFAFIRQWRRGTASKASEPSPDCQVKPRHREVEPPNIPSQLERGFYLYPKTQVIHYVSEDKKLRGVSSIKESLLTRQELNPAQMNAAQSPQKPHINRGCAAYALELESLTLLKQNQTDKACELLAYAVAEDLRRISFNSGPPSIRLYDLLAGVSLRTGRTEYLDEMIHRIDDAAARGSGSRQSGWISEPTVPAWDYTPYTTVLQARIRKWKNPRSRWHRRWSDRAKKVTWKWDKNTGLVF